MMATCIDCDQMLKIAEEFKADISCWWKPTASDLCNISLGHKECSEKS